MDKYKYVKAPPGHELKKPTPLSHKLRRALFITILVIGITSLTTATYPIISYQLFYAPSFARARLISPQANTTTDVPSPDLIQTTLDYTDSSNWFIGRSEVGVKRTKSPIYTLSIPRLDINKAIVRSDSTDLKASLIQYQGTAEPGSLGTPVIFGHSVLPQYFDPQNYVSIFSTLHTLKIGDEIYLDYDGIQYRYVIQDMYEVIPTDLSPLDQDTSYKGLRLITCTPPGTYLRRLVLEARLI